MLPHPVHPDWHPARSEQRMNLSLKDRHLLGMGAAVCAVCCAVPLLTLLGVVGAAATFVFAGVVFGLVVTAGALLAVWNQRRRRRPEASVTGVGPVDAALSVRQPGRDA